MKYTLALLLSCAAYASAQGVTAIITPPAPAPSGCATSYTGNFEINVANATIKAKRDSLEKRVTACGGAGTLVLTLADGLLHDARGKTGYIASNYQFQFDGPPQAGAIFTAGFSVCSNNTLALGGSAIFYQCLSGTFYNLYDQSTGAQCSEAYIDIIPCVDTSPGATTTTPVSAVPSTTPAVIASTTVSTVSILTTPLMNSTMTSSTANLTSATSVLMETSMTPSTKSSITSIVVVQSSAGHSQVSTTASSTMALSTGAGSLLYVGREVAALAAGVAAVVMI